MIEKERCSYARIGGETFENCREVEVVKNDDEGTILGWFMCLMASSSFTYGCDYSWLKGKCECKGPVVPIMWRR